MRLNVYLNFPGTSEKAFEFYRSIFGGDFSWVSRFADVPDLPNRESMSEEELNKIMHIALPVGGMTLMATDALDSMNQHLIVGDNVSLSLHPESRAEADRLFQALSTGGEVTMPLTDMFWGAYYGMLTDPFGIQWMINCEA